MSTKPNPDAFAGLVRTAAQACERTGHNEALAQAADRTYRDVVAELAEARAQIDRLWRENHEAAQRAFYLQPGVRVRLASGHEGVTQAGPVQASVLLDGHAVAVHVDSKFLGFVARELAAPARVTVDGVDIGTARNIRLASLEPDGTPVPYVIADGPEPDDAERPPFHHETGNPSDYLEALAEEVHNGPRPVERLTTIAEGSVLNVVIRFGTAPVRGALTDLLYVDRP